MGWGFGIEGHNDDGTPRLVGYMLLATCDRRYCGEEINRGLSYRCGAYPMEGGCGRYYCDKDSSYVGPRGGCSHRGTRAWGQVISCMVENPEGDTVCLDRKGHETLHAWEEGYDDI